MLHYKKENIEVKDEKELFYKRGRKDTAKNKE